MRARGTTVELDDALVERAKRALRLPTARATIEEALRRAAAGAEDEHDERRDMKRRYLERLATRVDVDVLAGQDMWR